MKRYYLLERENFHEYGDRYASLIEVDFSNNECKKAFNNLRDFIKELSCFDSIKGINKKNVDQYKTTYNACITRYEECIDGYNYEDNFFKIW